MTEAKEETPLTRYPECEDSGQSRFQSGLIILGIGASCYVCGWILASFPPLFPSLANKRGITEGEYGFAFSMSPLASLLVSPWIGRNGIKFLSAKWILISGLLIQAFASFGIGLLQFIEDFYTFLCLSFLLRFINGVGDACTYVSFLSIPMAYFSSHPSSILAWTEVVLGFGYGLGPGMCLFFYSIGNFFGCFLAICVTLLLISSYLAKALPKLTCQKQDKKPDEETGGSTTFWLFLPYLDVASNEVLNSLRDSMLNDHMRDLIQASQSEITTTFLISNLIFTIPSMILGSISEKIRVPIILSLLGNAFMILALALLDPLPFLINQASLTQFRIASSCVVVAHVMIEIGGFARIYQNAKRDGIQDDVKAFLELSGKFVAAFYFGQFIGPSLAGILVEYFGFRIATCIFMAWAACMTIINGIATYRSQN